MNDEILENIWKIKEEISRNAPEGFSNLAEYITNEASEIRKRNSFSKGTSYTAVQEPEGTMSVHENEDD